VIATTCAGSVMTGGRSFGDAMQFEIVPRLDESRNHSIVILGQHFHLLCVGLENFPDRRRIRGTELQHGAIKLPREDDAFASGVDPLAFPSGRRIQYSGSRTPSRTIRHFPTNCASPRGQYHQLMADTKSRTMTTTIRRLRRFGGDGGEVIRGCG
jgi:hypothetical protein